MSTYKITIKAGNPAVFDPNPRTAQPNDTVFWFNSDPTNAHWPAPSVAEKTAWFPYQIPPGASSDPIGMVPYVPPKAYTLNYVCALHPNETGQINVTLGKKKGAFGGKTKKGAFGQVTTKSAFGKVSKVGTIGKVKEGAFGKVSKEGAFGKISKQGALGKISKKGAFGKNTR